MRICVLILCSVLFLNCTPKPKPPMVGNQDGFAVAKVGDTVITDKDLMGRIDAIEKNFPRTYSTHPQKKQLLEEMMHIELLYHQALALNLDKRYEFKSRLADLYLQQLSEQARAKLTDQELRAEFENHLDEYQQISVRHILLRPAAANDTKSKEAARAQIMKIRAEALKDPSKFSELAVKYSQDGSATNGGELGFFSRGMMVAPFSAAAFALKKIGEISDIIETQFGYHIIQLSGDHRSYDFHKDIIRDRLLRSTQRQRLSEELARLSKEMKPEIFEDNLAKLSPLPSAVSGDPNKLVPPEEEKTKKSP